MAARHRERYCASVRQLSTITPEICPRSNGISVHDALESLSSMSRNNQLVLPAVDRPVGHPYSDLPEGGISARCYAYEEVFGEKVRALAERT